MRLRWSILLLSPALVGACDRDRSGLEPDPPSTASSTGTGTGGEGGTGTTASSSAATGGGPQAPEEPDQPPKLTLLHGLVDRTSLRFCLLPFPGLEGDGVPLPASPLAFAEHVTLGEVGADLPASDVLVAAVIGESGSSTCGELVGEPLDPGVEVFSLGVLPESALDAERHLLVAAVGCAGGDGHEHENQAAACGSGYAPNRPSVQLVATGLSRIIEPSAIALQAVHGVVAAGPLDVRLAPTTGTERALATQLSLGGALPFPPMSQLDAVTLGTASLLEVGFYPPSSQSALGSRTLGDAMSRAGLAAGDFINGRGFAIVAVGPAPNVGPGPFWHDFAIAIVPTGSAE